MADSRCNLVRSGHVQGGAPSLFSLIRLGGAGGQGRERQLGPLAAPEQASPADAPEWSHNIPGLTIIVWKCNTEPIDIDTESRFERRQVGTRSLSELCAPQTKISRVRGSDGPKVFGNGYATAHVTKTHRAPCGPMRSGYIRAVGSDDVGPENSSSWGA